MGEEEEPARNRAPTKEERQKWLAEARRADAEAAKAMAEAALFNAEEAKFHADARDAAARADIQQIGSRKALREEEEHLAANQYHRIYHFTDQVSSATVHTAMKQIDVWRRHEIAPIEVVFTSPGGSVIDGMVFFDYLQMVRRTEVHVTTGTLGMAASMAGILLQAGDLRWMGKEAWYLIHEASFAAVGSMGQVEDTVEWIKKLQKRVIGIFASRSKMSEAYISRRWKRKDWWIDSDEALKLGLVDELR